MLSVEFEYDGVIPSDNTSSLSDPPRHEIVVSAVDTDGECSSRVHLFSLIGNIATPMSPCLRDRQVGTVFSVAFSPDGTTLASGLAQDNTIKLWDIATKDQYRHVRTGIGEQSVQ